MNARQLTRLCRTALFIALVAAFLSAMPALANGEINNLRATKVGEESITVSWGDTPGASGHGYDVFIGPAGGNSNDPAGGTDGTSYTINGLRPDTAYRIIVVITGNPHLGHSEIFVTTGDNDEDEEASTRRPKAVPPPDTCPKLPARVAVFGYIKRVTQCQMVDAAGIGRLDLIQRGFIDAVDVWSYVNGGLEICFRNDGWLVFLDAAYTPRMLMELERYHRDGMTCGTIDSAGTVALVSSTAPQYAESTLPVFEAIPLSGCQIKLVETLFLRAEPGGEIIGLVWLNSEVSAFEINGYWYRVEFEGQTGYISRYYRRVLNGGCG